MTHEAEVLRNYYAPCDDCGTHLMPRDDAGQPVPNAWEWYLLEDGLWESVADGARFLCIGCVERRLGYRLAASDFKQWKGRWTNMTPRLEDRSGAA